MSWHLQPMIGFDLETSGVDPETAHIVTACVGWASASGWRPRNYLLKQTQPIPEAATAVHGISTEHANTHGTDPAETLAEIAETLTNSWAQGTPVVGFNIVYDFTVLDRNLRRHGFPGLRVTGPVIDCLVLDKATHTFRPGSRKLIDVARHHRIKLTEEEAHGAEADALASCRLAYKLAALPPDPEVYPGPQPRLGEMTLRELHAFPRGRLRGAAPIVRRVPPPQGRAPRRRVHRLAHPALPHEGGGVSTLGTIYLAGPMSGLPDFNYPAFHAAAAKLRADGHTVLNPAENPEPSPRGDTVTWADWMRLALAQLIQADTVVLLPGWWVSRGAVVEYKLARDLGLAIIEYHGGLLVTVHEAEAA